MYQEDRTCVKQMRRDVVGAGQEKVVKGKVSEVEDLTAMETEMKKDDYIGRLKTETKPEDDEVLRIRVMLT